MISQTRTAVVQSHLNLFLLDCKAGISGADKELARWLHTHMKQNEDKVQVQDVVLVGNKAEGTMSEEVINTVFKLGFGEPVYISAEHGDGMVDLYQRIREKIPESYFQEHEIRLQKRKEKQKVYKEKFQLEVEELEKELGEQINKRDLLKEFDQLNPEDMSELDSDTEYDPDKIIAKPTLPGTPETTHPKTHKPIQISIIGRPNVGKSTFVNALLQTDRVIADDLPGTTRDSVYTEMNHDGRNLILVDTAGLIKHPQGHLNEMIKNDVMRAVRYSQVVILLFDSMTALTKMDLELARVTVQEGRALIVAGNKWDLVAGDWRKRAADYMAEQTRKNIDIKNLPMLFLSAKECSRITDLMELVIKTYDRWNIRISTGYLNRWLGAFKKVQSLPSGGGERLSIKYMAQIKSRPPTFYVFVNNKELMKINYLKNFRNALAKEFGIEGIPIRILLRDKANKKEKVRKQKPGFIIKGKESKPMGRSAIFTKPTSQKKPQSRKSSPRSKVK